MGKFQLGKTFRKNLEYFAEQKIEALAREAQEKLREKYISLIDFYYADYISKLSKYDEPYYTRTFNLYNSFRNYYSNRHNGRIYSGIKIEPNGRMNDYTNLQGKTFSASALIDKFIYNQSGTWHGGDWHGGYGVKNSFSVYNEIWAYRDKLLKEYKKKSRT